MKHIDEFSTWLEQTFNIASIVEPSRASSNKNVRILPGKLSLHRLPPAANQTDIPYACNIEMLLSFRLEGANERLSLTQQALFMSMLIDEKLADNIIPIETPAYSIENGLNVSAPASVTDFKKKNGDFHHIEGGNDKLFMYREDWTCSLNLHCLRRFDSPLLKSVTGVNEDGETLFTAQEDQQ